MHTKMTSLATVLLLVPILGLGILGISAAFAAEEAVSLQDLPPAVRAAIEKYAAGSRINEIQRIEENGNVTYEAEVIVNGKETDVVVSAAGELVPSEQDEEEAGKAEDEGKNDVEDEGQDETNAETISWDQLPQAVRDAAQREFPGVQPTEMDADVEDGVGTYEVVYEVNGLVSGLTLTESGQIVETEEGVAPSDLPAAVTAQIQSRFPDAEIQEANLVVSTFYEIDVKAGDETQEVRVFANGKMLDEGND